MLSHFFILFLKKLWKNKKNSKKKNKKPKKYVLDLVMSFSASFLKNFQKKKEKKSFIILVIFFIIVEERGSILKLTTLSPSNSISNQMVHNQFF
jgi:uncharacterized membrane protein YbjE (DUF340 family)